MVPIIASLKYEYYACQPLHRLPLDAASQVQASLGGGRGVGRLKEGKQAASLRAAVSLQWVGVAGLLPIYTALRKLVETLPPLCMLQRLLRHMLSTLSSFASVLDAHGIQHVALLGRHRRQVGTCASSIPAVQPLTVRPSTPVTELHAANRELPTGLPNVAQRQLPTAVAVVQVERLVDQLAQCLLALQALAKGQLVPGRCAAQLEFCVPGLCHGALS